MKMIFQKKHGLEVLDEEAYFEKGRKVGSMWGVCSDIYLAPAYSECTENIDQLFQADMEDWATEEFRNKMMEVEACMLLKQSEHYYKVSLQQQRKAENQTILGLFGCWWRGGGRLHELLLMCSESGNARTDCMCHLTVMIFRP